MFSVSNLRQLQSATPRTVTLPMAAGPLEDLLSEAAGRRLTDKVWKFPTGAFVKAGSECEVTVGGMPKIIKCTLEAGMDKFDFSIVTRISLGYGIDGSTYVLLVETGFETSLGTAADLPEGLDVSMLDKIDVGTLIDASLAGCITLAPPALNFPATFSSNGDLYTVARIKIPALPQDGVCLSNLQQVAPGSEIAKLAGVLNKFANVIGGDMCVQAPGLACSADNGGFSLSVHAVLKLFDKDLVDAWPMIETLADLDVEIKTVFDLIEKVCGDELKTALNAAVKSIMPDELDFTVDVGVLVAMAAGVSNPDANPISGPKVPSNRRLSDSIIGADGVFALGGVAASSRPGVAPIGPIDPSGPPNPPNPPSPPSPENPTGAPSPAGAIVGGVIAVIAVAAAVATISLLLIQSRAEKMSVVEYLKRIVRPSEKDRKEVSLVDAGYLPPVVSAPPI